MVIDFSHHLYNAIVAFISLEQENEKILPEFKRRWGSPSKIEIVKCAKGLDGEYASPIAFKLAQIFAKDLGNDKLLPLEIANRILLMLSKGLESRCFNVTIGGGGYINFSLSEEGKRIFLCTAAKDPSMLFSDKLSSSKVPPIAFDVEIDSNWESPLTRASALSDGELKDFAERLKREESCSFDDFLMLLACLEDDNFDPRPYLMGLKGSQNLGWQFARFFDDVRKVSSFFKIDDQKEPNTLTLGPDYLSNCSRELLDIVVESRQVFSQSLLSSRPEILLFFLLRVIGAYYKFYNYPQFRDMLARGGSDPSDGGLLVFARYSLLLEEIVSGGIRYLSVFYSKMNESL